MLLFRSEQHVENWRRQWGREPGAILSLKQAWALGQAWYADRLDPAWKGRSHREAEALFGKIGLSGEFWKFAD